MRTLEVKKWGRHTVQTLDKREPGFYSNVLTPDKTDTQHY